MPPALTSGIGAAGFGWAAPLASLFEHSAARAGACCTSPSLLRCWNTELGAAEASGLELGESSSEHGAEGLLGDTLTARLGSGTGSELLTGVTLRLCCPSSWSWLKLCRPLLTWLVLGSWLLVRCRPSLLLIADSQPLLGLASPALADLKPLSDKLQDVAEGESGA